MNSEAKETQSANRLDNTPLDEKVPAQKVEGIKRIKMGNFVSATAQGIAFLHGGQERGRSKPKLNATTELEGNFVKNSYDAADNINQFVWNIDDDYQGLLDYTKGLIEMRRNTTAFRLGSKDAVDENTEFLHDEILGTVNVIAYTVKADGYKYYVVMNGSEVPFTLKTKDSMNGAEVLTDSIQAGSKAIKNPVGVKARGKTITVAPLLCTVVRVK